MSSPGTTTAAPSLLGDWTPGRPGCLQQKDWWIWSYDGANRDARTVLGGPSQTTDCFPTAGAPTGTYAGTQCPPNYSAACTNKLSENGAVTCCPTAYAFSCVPEPFTISHLDSFRCLSRHGTTGSPTIILTDFKAHTQKTIQPKQASHEHLFAMALVYQTPLPTGTSIPGATASASSGDAPPSLPSETGSSQPSSSSESSGLSGAASAGVGVGAGVGVLLLALVAFLLYRRRRRDSTRGKSELPTTTYAPPTGGRRRRHHPQPQWSKPLIRRRATCTTSTQAAAWATAANTGQGRATRPIGMTGSNTRRWDRPHPRSRPRIPWCQGGSRWTVGMPGQNYRATGIKIVAKCRTVPSFPSWEWTQMILDINNHSS
ncbi:hypothetical protein PG999_011879 [Apiospora kogelbergensis]|uniref:Uncharacterized protein n=1 Tax=Apiospora kogelbergensis TaxID=1337665 RepID=A0AAW0QE97_9PEZI